MADEDLKNCRRGFVHTGDAWYGNVVLPDRGLADEVMIGLYPEDADGGTLGEFAVRWRPLMGRDKPVPQLVAFDDAWQVFPLFTDVLIEALPALADSDATPEQVCEALAACGVVDLTQREAPD